MRISSVMKILLCLVPLLLLSACVIGENLTFEEKVQAHIEQVRSEDVSEISLRIPEMVGGSRAFYDVLRYPQSAMQDGATGTVTLGFYVNEYGIIENLEVVRSDRSDFSRAAIRAKEQMLYIPSVTNGKRVGVNHTFTVHFRLMNF